MTDYPPRNRAPHDVTVINRWLTEAADHSGVAAGRLRRWPPHSYTPKPSQSFATCEQTAEPVPLVGIGESSTQLRGHRLDVGLLGRVEVVPAPPHRGESPRASADVDRGDHFAR